MAASTVDSVDQAVDQAETDLHPTKAPVATAITSPSGDANAPSNAGKTSQSSDHWNSY